MAQNNSSFVVQNGRALTDVLDRAALASSESTLRQAAVAGARVFMDEIKLRAPVRKGTLRDNVIIAYDSENSVAGKLATYLVTFTKLAWYARFVEFGTSKMAAEPFIRPAFEARKEDAADTVTEKIQEAVRNG